MIDKTLRPQRQRGFTFLEVMIALSMIALVLVGIYRLQSQTILMTARSRFDAIAPLLAQRKLSEIELDLKDAVGGSGDFGDETPGFTWEVSVSDVTSETLGQVADGLKQVDVTVKNEVGVTYTLRTYRLVAEE